MWNRISLTVRYLQRACVYVCKRMQPVCVYVQSEFTPTFYQKRTLLCRLISRACLPDLIQHAACALSVSWCLTGIDAPLIIPTYDFAWFPFVCSWCCSYFFFCLYFYSTILKLRYWIEILYIITKRSAFKIKKIPPSDQTCVILLKFRWWQEKNKTLYNKTKIHGRLNEHITLVISSYA